MVPRSSSPAARNAPATAAPLDIPAKIPSRTANWRAVSKASSSSTVSLASSAASSIDLRNDRLAHVLQPLHLVAEARLDADDAHPGFHLAQVAADPHQGSRGPHAGDEEVYRSAGLGENLRTGRLVVGLGVGLFAYWLGM